MVSAYSLYPFFQLKAVMAIVAFCEFAMIWGNLTPTCGHPSPAWERGSGAMWCPD